MNAGLLIWEVLCLALLYSVFCRLVHTTSKHTRMSVRIAIYLLGLSAIVGLGAPLYGWVPDVVSGLILAASLLMQIVAARHWRGGVPVNFQKG